MQVFSLHIMHEHTSSEITSLVSNPMINRITYITGFIYTVLKAGHKMGSAN